MVRTTFQFPTSGSSVLCIKGKYDMGNETNVTCEDVELTAEQGKFLKNCAWWIEVCGNLPIAIIGVVLNVIAVLVLSTSSMRSNFFNRLLFVLAIFDSLYLVCEISEVFRHRYPTFGQQHAFVNFVYPIRSVFMCSSIFMTIALTIERYQAITNPIEYRARGSSNMMKRLLCYVMPVLTFSILYYIPKYVDLDVDEVLKCINGTETRMIPIRPEINPEDTQFVNCTREYPLIPTPLRINHHYVLWYINISNLVLTAIIPVCVLLYLNCRIYSALKNFMQRQPSAQLTTQMSNASTGSEMRSRSSDVKKTFILFFIVIIFVLCHTIRIVLNVNEFLSLTRLIEIREKGCNNATKFWVQIAVPINQLLIIINSSCNFFIYCFIDPAFQNVLRQACIANRVPQRNDTMQTSQTINREPKTSRLIRLQNNHTENIELSNMNSIDRA